MTASRPSATSVVLNATFLLSMALGLAVLTSKPALAQGESSAEGPTDPRQIEAVLEAWTESIGDPAFTAEIENVYYTWDATLAGVDGTYEKWVTRDGRWRVELQVGGIEYVQILGPGGGWERKPNGVVAERTGNNLASDRTDAFLWSPRLFAPDRAGLRLAFDRVSDTGQWIYKTTPPGGLETALFLDPEHFRPTRYVEPREDRTVATHLSDWQRVDGAFLPHRVRRESDDPADNADFILRNVQFDLELPPGFFDRPDDLSRSYTFDQGTEAFDIPIDVGDGVIYVQASVNGSPPVWFLLDSASAMTVIDLEWARELELRTSPARDLPNANVDLVSDLTLRLPGVTLTNYTAAAFPLDNYSLLAGRPLRGIIGFDLFERLVVELDYAEAVMHLREPESFQYFGSGESFVLRTEGGKPHLLVAYSPDSSSSTTPVELVVDTGSSDELLFSRGYVESEGLGERIEATVLTAGTHPGGTQKRRLARFPTVEIGTLALSDVVCALAIQDDPSAGTSGSVGGGLLRRFRVVVDSPHRKIFFEPNDQFDAPSRVSASGLLLRDIGLGDPARIQVLGVLPGSPADVAGVVAGDEILLIDGRSAGELGLFELRELLRRERGTVRLTVRRAATEHELSIALRPLL